MMRHLFFALVFACLAACGGDAAVVPCDVEALQNAYRLKAQVDRAGRRDIELLWDELQESLKAHGTDPRDRAFIALVKTKLRRDRGKLTVLYGEMVRQPTVRRGSWPFRSSLGKLVGRTESGGRYIGILEEAENFLDDEELFRKRLDALDLKLKDRTPFKTLLLYGVLVTERSETLDVLASCPRFRQLQLIYPTELPSWISPDGTENVALCCGRGTSARLEVPNNGYVFGGNLCRRGGDCSAFCSEVTGSSVRLSTEMMAMAAKVLRNGEGSLTGAEHARYRELLREGLDRTLKEFAAVLPADVGPGDLVGWRRRSGGGHVVVYDRPVKGSPNEFVGIELNRDDDKSKPDYREGIGVRAFKLQQDGMDTFILRRRRIR